MRKRRERQRKAPEEVGGGHMCACGGGHSNSCVCEGPGYHKRERMT